MKYQRLFSFILIPVISACATVAEVDPATPTRSVPPPTNEIDLPAIAPIQPTFSEPTLAEPIERDAESIWKGDQMPTFLEVIQTTLMGEDSAQSPTIGVGPAVYFYTPDSKVLMLHSTITLAPTTELLIGVNAILQTPGQVYEKKSIIQYPSAKLDLIQISAFDNETGMINLVYEGESFDLYPGESRTFKQVGSGSNTPTVITQVLNHGLLAEIQPTSPDGSWR